MKVSRSQEDYLERILSLASQKGDVRVTDLATDMNISKPSVNKAIGLLKNQGLVDHEKYGTLTLTPKGEAYAKNVEKRHTVLKRFLCDVLKVDEARAEEEACAIEHGVSLDTIERLDRFLEEGLGGSKN